jgi:uncharacterized protein DUF4352
MSVYPPVESPPEPGVPESAPRSHKEAKAAAKAAKAYAKAQRPWYKKKRFVLPLGLLLLIVVVAAASSGGGTGSGDSAISGSGNTGSASKSDDGKSGKVGQALTNAGTTYKVTKVQTTDKLGDPALGGARTDGTFVVVSLELTNNKDQTKTFLDSSAKIKTSDGKQYKTSDKAVLAFGDEGLLLKDIQPDLTTRGKLAFELPSGKVSGSTLVVEDLFGSGEIKVDLGL